MVNKVILIGNMGADPEVRTFEDGNKVARLRVATTERFYNKNTQEAKEHTEWHTVTLWRSQASFAEQYARKGSQVYIEGRLRSREWEDEQKNKRFSVEVLADDFRLLGRRTDGAASTTSGNTAGGYGSASGAPTGGYGAASSSYGSSAPQGGGYPSQAPAAGAGSSYGQPQNNTTQPVDSFDTSSEADDLPF